MLKVDARISFKLSILLIITYILFFLTNGLAFISDVSPWTGFILSTVLSVGALIFSIIAILNDNWLQPAYITAFISYLLILFTIFIFLIPEMGIPDSKPLILQLIINQL